MNCGRTAVARAADQGEGMGESRGDRRLPPLAGSGTSCLRGERRRCVPDVCRPAVFQMRCVAAAVRVPRRIARLDRTWCSTSGGGPACAGPLRHSARSEPSATRRYPPLTAAPPADSAHRPPHTCARARVATGRPGACRSAGRQNWPPSGARRVPIP